MTSVKILLGTAALCCLILALLMLWNEQSLSLTFFEVKFMESLFVISAVILAKDCAGIKKR